MANRKRNKKRNIRFGRYKEGVTAGYHITNKNGKVIRKAFYI